MAELTVHSAVSGPVTYEVVADRVRIVRAGSAIVEESANEAGDQYQNDGTVSLEISNSGGVDVKVTRLAQRTLSFDPYVAPDDVVVCPFGESTLLPPVNPNVYNDALGKVQLRYPPGTAPDLLIFAVRIPPVR